MLACALLSPVAGFAKPVIYACDIDNTGSVTWVPKLVIIAYEPGEARAQVADPIIYHFNKKQPVEARVGVDNAKRLTLAWDLDVRDRAGTRAIMNFSLTIRKAELRASISSRVNAFDYAESAGGTCKLK